MLIKKAQVAEMLCMPQRNVEAFLSSHGIHAIPLAGYSNGWGKRWLKAAVEALVLDLHEKAQPKPKPQQQKRQKPYASSLAGKTTAEVYAMLTSSACVQ